MIVVLMPVFIAEWITRDMPPFVMRVGADRIRVRRRRGTGATRRKKPPAGADRQSSDLPPKTSDTRPRKADKPVLKSNARCNSRNVFDRFSRSLGRHDRTRREPVQR